MPGMWQSTPIAVGLMVGQAVGEPGTIRGFSVGKALGIDDGVLVGV